VACTGRLASRARGTAIIRRLARSRTRGWLPSPGAHPARIAREIEGLRQWAGSNCRMAAELEATEPSAEADSIAGRRARMVDV